MGKGLEQRSVKRGDITHISQKARAKVMEESKERVKGQGSVATAASQDIGPENAQKQRSFNSRVTIVVKRVTRQHNVKCLKEGEKERDSTKSATKASGHGSRARQILRSVARSDQPPPNPRSQPNRGDVSWRRNLQCHQRRGVQGGQTVQDAKGQQMDYSTQCHVRVCQTEQSEQQQQQ